MRHAAMILLLWYFAVFSYYSNQVIGPFRGKDLCDGARTWALQNYQAKQVTPCWTDGR